MTAYDVEVFPIEPTRWVAVIEGPRGIFSTETTDPELVVDEVRSSIGDVWGDADPRLRLVDEDGRPWAVDTAATRLADLDDR